MLQCMLNFLWNRLYVVPARSVVVLGFMSLCREMF